MGLSSLARRARRTASRVEPDADATADRRRRQLVAFERRTWCWLGWARAKGSLGCAADKVGDAMVLMQLVPEALLREVLQQLARAGEFASIASASCACRALAQLAAEDELWEAAWRRSWPTGWGMLCEQSLTEQSHAAVSPAPVELARAMAAASPPAKQAPQVAVAMAMLSVCARINTSEDRLLDGEPLPPRSTGPQHQQAPVSTPLLRDRFRHRWEAVRWQRTARGSLPRPLAGMMARTLAVATGSFLLEGEVTDASDGNVTPVSVELALSHGYCCTEPAVGKSDARISSAYARAGSLHASVCYGKGTLHNTPTDAVWSGGWCAMPLESIHTRIAPEFAVLKLSATLCRWCDHKSPDVFVLSFREQIVGTQTLSQYMYDGRIDLDGSTLTGTFKHRFFPCEHAPCPRHRVQQ